MKTYFYCNVDNFGQRNGTYDTISLHYTEVETDNTGNIYYKGQFLYENESECLTACLN